MANGNGVKKPSKDDLKELADLEDNLRDTELQFQKNFDSRQSDYAQASLEWSKTIGEAKAAIDVADSTIDVTKMTIEEAKRKNKL